MSPLEAWHEICEMSIGQNIAFGALVAIGVGALLGARYFGRKAKDAIAEGDRHLAEAKGHYAEAMHLLSEAGQNGAPIEVPRGFAQAVETATDGIRAAEAARGKVFEETTGMNKMMKESWIITGAVLGAICIGTTGYAVGYRLGATRSGTEATALSMALLSGMKQQAFAQAVYDLRQSIRSIALEGGNDRPVTWTDIRDRKLLPPNVYGVGDAGFAHLYGGDWRLAGSIRHPAFTLAALPQDACVIEALDAQATTVKVNQQPLAEMSRVSAMAACAQTVNTVELTF